MSSLEGKVAIVTGAGRGIGRAIALHLAELGANVLVNSYSDANAAATHEAIQQVGGKSQMLSGDVGDSEFCNKLIDFAAKEMGGISILVNNAGITRDNLIMRLKDEDWDKVMTTNLKSAFLLSRAAIRPMMKSRWGRIINISSIVGVIGNPGQTNYAASKAGMIGLTKSLAREVASRNILVNCVAPGFIETSMTGELSEEQQKSLADQIPLQRLGKPEDIAGVVAFLCSEGANYITGQTLEVTGGLGM